MNDRQVRGSENGADAVPMSGGAARLVHAQIVAAAADLERLLKVLDQAGADLMARFSAFDRLVARISREGEGSRIAEDGRALQAELLGATTALQFQDMSTQLVNHALNELRTLAERLGDDTEFHGTNEVPTVVRPGPVSQSDIGAGSIELF